MCEDWRPLYNSARAPSRRRTGRPESPHFFGTSQAAKAYAAPVINGADGNPLPPVVLELTIFSRRATDAFPIGGDEVVFYRAVNDLYLVKNPLVIFPTAVFERGEKFANTPFLVNL